MERYRRNTVRQNKCSFRNSWEFIVTLVYTCLSICVMCVWISELFWSFGTIIDSGGSKGPPPPPPKFSHFSHVKLAWNFSVHYAIFATTTASLWLRRHSGAESGVRTLPCVSDRDHLKLIDPMRPRTLTKSLIRKHLENVFALSLLSDLLLVVCIDN